MKLSVVLLGIFVLACTISVQAASMEHIESSVHELVHHEESNAVVASMQSAANSLLAEEQSSQGLSEEQQGRLSRLIQLIDALLQRLRKQRKQNHAQFSASKAECKKDIAHDRAFIREKRSKIRHLEAELRIVGDRINRLKDEGRSILGEMTSKRQRADNLLARMNEEKSQQRTRVGRIQRTISETEELIKLLQLIDSKLTQNNLMEVDSQLSQALTQRAGQKDEISSMLELTVDAVRRKKGNANAPEGSKEIHDLIALLIKQLQDELKLAREQLNNSQASYKLQMDELTAQVELFKQAVKGYERQNDDAISNRDKSIQEQMNLRDDLKFAKGLMSAKKAHLKARVSACGKSEISYNKRQANLVRQIRVLKQILAMLNAKDGGKTVRAVASAIKNVDLKMPVWSASSWSKCSAQCGVGIQTRKAVCKVNGREASAQQCKGKRQPLLQRACNNGPCKRDCILSSWSTWSDCSAECGGGVSKRSRSILALAANGGKICPAESSLEQSRACNQKACSNDCQMSQWSQWSVCSAKCGLGQQSRSRGVIQPARGDGQKCPTNIKESQPCMMAECDANGQPMAPLSGEKRIGSVGVDAKRKVYNSRRPDASKKAAVKKAATGSLDGNRKAVASTAGKKNKQVRAAKFVKVRVPVGGKKAGKQARKKAGKKGGRRQNKKGKGKRRVQKKGKKQASKKKAKRSVKLDSEATVLQQLARYSAGAQLLPRDIAEMYLATARDATKKAELEKRINAFLDSNKGADGADFCQSLDIEAKEQVYTACLVAMMTTTDEPATMQQWREWRKSQ